MIGKIAFKIFSERRSDRRFRFVGAIVLVLVVAASASAQVTVSGALRGNVVDQNNAVLADAAITLINRETNQTQTATTDDAGEYQFARVAPGFYTIRAEAANFRPALQDNVQVTVNEIVRLNFTLAVGEISGAVTVDSGAGVLQTDSSDVSQIVTERRITELPLNGRNFARLVQLAPGVGGVGPASGLSSPSFSGGRPSGNVFTIDGVNTTDERLPLGITIGGGAASVELGETGQNLVSTEALREFRVITSNGDATVGFGSGGQVNIITKSGTNRFSGAVYNFLRNDALDARDFFAAGENPPYRQNLFGGTLGGRIVRDRHFFFVNYEGLRQTRERPATAFVPNQTLINLLPGDLRRVFTAYYTNRNLIPNAPRAGATFTPLAPTVRAAAVSAGFPAALFDGNFANDEAATILVTNNRTINVRQNNFLVRTDHRFGEKINVAGRFAFADPQRTYSLFTSAPNELRRDPSVWYSGLGQIVYLASPSHIFEFRASYNYSRKLFENFENTIDRQAVGIRAPDAGLSFAFPTTELENFYLAAEPNGLDIQKTPQAAFLHTLTRGNLTLRSGVDWRVVRVDVDNPSGRLTTYTFTGYVGAGSLLGTSPAQTTAIATSAQTVLFGLSNTVPTSLRKYKFAQQEYFAQADWRVSRQVTLNLGLRYSYFSPFSETQGILSNLYAVDASGNPIPNVSPFVNGRAANRLFPVSDDLPFHKADTNNFQPRLGIAWNIGGRNRTIFRAGYGTYLDRFFAFVFSGGATNQPFAAAANVTAPAFVFNQQPTVNAVVPSILAVDPTLKNPVVHRYNVSVEQSLDKNTSVTAAYVGTLGRSLIRRQEPNGSGFIPQNLRPDARFADQIYITNSSASRYDSLQISARRRFADGVDFTAAYTFARSLDEPPPAPRAPSLINLGANPNLAGIQGGGALFVERPRQSDYNYSNFDVRHNFTFSHVFELPFGKGRRFLNDLSSFADAIIGGWSVNGIFIFRSGEPFTVTLGRDVNDDGDATRDRPVLINGNLSNLYAGGANRTQYLITAAEAAQYLRTANFTFEEATNPFLAIPANAFRSPSVRVYDLSLVKQIRFGERINLRLEANAFNIFNTPQFAAPISSLSNPRFGQITATRVGFNPRQIQLGVKLSF